MNEQAPIASTSSALLPQDNSLSTEKQSEKSTQMHIKVYSPFHVYYDDKAKSISAINGTGPFDILPGHRNFITLVNACELVIRTVNDQEEKIKISRAVMHVKADEVRVFLDV
ncbi:hypothetical protein EB118_01505 [bacterium]|nr:hypothetical protein [bacterium]NBX98546.1 hypothetical protein [bacterium]NDC93820.1 hypothetical protein [bacterium]NDD83610.1 hypothetical protein [bacterium]NDG28766.1 hypothetical protein [bacterium]